MVQKRRIAIVTTWFPPKKGVAVNRMQSFAEYLSHDFDVTVFCEGSKNLCVQKENYKIYYVSSTFLSFKFETKPEYSKLKHLLLTGLSVVSSKVRPLPYRRWQGKVLEKLVSVHNDREFSCIISSSAPIEAHLVVSDFKIQFPHVAWIADMRDQLSKNPYYEGNLKWIKKYEHFEEIIAKSADAVTSVSAPIVEEFKQIMGEGLYFEEIRNGFDHNFVFLPGRRNLVVKFGYFGTFYGIHKPKPLFDSLIELVKVDSNFRFELHFFGTHKNFQIPVEIEKFISFHSNLPYFEAVEKMNEMDFNILMIPKFNSKGIFTGKLFDYISARKPIIGILDKDSVAAKLINELNCGYCADYDTPVEISKIISEAYLDWGNHLIRYASDNDVQLQHRKIQVEKLIGLINKLIK